VPPSLRFVWKLSRMMYPDSFSRSSGRRYFNVQIWSLRDVYDIGRFMGYGKAIDFH
jgi:hypothetical protein